MFRRTKHYVLTAPMECFLSKGHQFFSGKVVNLSLHGAFVAETANSALAFEPGDLIGMNVRLHGPGVGLSDLEVKARVVWRNGGTEKNLPSGLGLEFIHDEQTLRESVTMISELCRRNAVQQDGLQPTAPLPEAPSA